MTGADGYRDTPLRSYVLTGGRARPSRNWIRVDTLLVADPGKPLPVSAGRRQRSLLSMCTGLLSLVEAAAHLGLPVSVVTVMASDLVDSGHLQARSAAHPSAAPDRALLLEVLDGLRTL